MHCVLQPPALEPRLAGRRILITGVAGFIGSNLADELLRQGCDVVGVDDLSQGRREQVAAGVEFHCLDINSPDLRSLFTGVEVVFHLAAKNCLSDCEQDPAATARTNVAGTVNVLEMARQARVRKVVLASSSATYEESRRVPTPESECAPHGAYALSKAAADLWAAAYQRSGRLNLTVLRYFCVYGPRQDVRRSRPPLMSAFVMALLSGQPPVIYGTGEQRRDFIHVDDVNRFHMQCITDARSDGGVFNVGSGQSWSVLEILAGLQKLLGTRVQPNFSAGDEERVQETRADLTAISGLGWQPQVGMTPGLETVIAWLRQRRADESGRRSG